MGNNRKTILAGILLAVVGLFVAVTMVRASADDMLYATARLLTEIQDGHAVVNFEVRTPEEQATGIVEVWGQQDVGPNGEPAFRIEVLESSKAEMVGATAVSNGTEFWMWNPEKGTVYVGTYAEMKAEMAERAGEYSHDGPAGEPADMPETPEEAVDKLLEYFTAERNGSETIGDMRANKLRLIPIPEQMPEELRANGGLLHVWMRTDDSAPLGIEYTGGAVGSGKAIATQLELNQGIDPAVFTFTIPDGAEVVNLADLEPEALSLDAAAAQADFTLLTPTEVPAGAQLANVLDVRGAMVQRYTLPDGGSFTVAQGPVGAAEVPEAEGEAVTVRGLPGMLYAADDGTRALLTWQEGDVTFWIGGDLTAEAALNVANSLK